MQHGGTTYSIAQANNALIFPGLGLGVSVSQAERVTDSMIRASAIALAGLLSVDEPGASLLPAMSELRRVSKLVAAAVAEAARADGVAAASGPKPQPRWTP